MHGRIHAFCFSSKSSVFVVHLASHWATAAAVMSVIIMVVLVSVLVMVLVMNARLGQLGEHVGEVGELGGHLLLGEVVAVRWVPG